MNVRKVIFGAALWTLCQVISPYSAIAAEGTGDVEVTLSLSGAVAVASGSFSVGDREISLEGGRTSYTVKDVAAGNQVISGDASDDTGARLLGVAGVVVQAGKVSKASLVLAPVKDVNAFCSRCHPAPGEPVTIGQKARDVHLTGDCEDCHTAHRKTDQRKFVIAPFADGNDLCLKCHDRGHGLRTSEICLNCHTLSRNEVEEGTAYISAASRTLTTIKLIGERKVPESLGCTYCHNSDLNKEKMRGVLTHFGAQASKHPVGYDFSKSAETEGEYLSTWDSAVAGELDCVDCHAAALLVDPSKENQATSAPYANHVDPSVMEREGNPFMLKDADPSTFCLSCHGKGEKFGKADLVLKGHGERNLVEADGTPLKTSACLDCHEAHYSNKAKLFSEGRNGAAAVEIGSAAGCTTLCHQLGDAAGGYDVSGHGKAESAAGKPMALSCGACHAVNLRHEGSRPKLLVFREDGVKSGFGTSMTSLCTACHQKYQPHGGKRKAGCLDCHDEHGEGTAGNISMVSANIPKNKENSESTAFEKAGAIGHAYFRADGAGLCDNALCHDGVKSADGTRAVPLKTLMTGGHHGGGDQLPGANCRKCHGHENPDGSWNGKKSQ